MKITKEDFEKAYFRYTNKVISQNLEVSVQTVIKKAKELGLSKGKGYFNRQKITII